MAKRELFVQHVLRPLHQRVAVDGFRIDHQMRCQCIFGNADRPNMQIVHCHHPCEIKQALARENIKSFMDSMRRIGYSREEIIRLLESSEREDTEK